MTGNMPTEIEPSASSEHTNGQGVYSIDNSNQINAQDVDNKLTYKSASVALPTMMDEYTKERERGGILDTKAVSLITILLALVTVYMPIIPFDKIITVYMSDLKNKIIIMIILLLIFIASLIVTGFTFVILVNVIKLKTYKRVDIDKITKEEFFTTDEDVYQRALCIHYKKLIIHNSSINDIKSGKLNICYLLTVISFTLLLISCIGMKML